VALVQGHAAQFRFLDEIPWPRLALPVERAGDLPRSLCQYGEDWPEVAGNLLGVCNDALEAGRKLRDLAQASIAAWGLR
jgi:hypothetical protein